MRRAAPLLAAAVALAVGASGCGSAPRTANSFCTVVGKYTDRFRALGEQMNQQNAAGNPFAALVIAFGSLGEVERFLGDLQKASPDEIQGDVAVAHDDMKYASDHLGSSATSLSGFFDMLGRSLAHQNSYRRVDDYAAQHCNETIFAPRSTSSG